MQLPFRIQARRREEIDTDYLTRRPDEEGKL